MDDTEIVELYWQREERAIRETACKYGAYCMKISMNILADKSDSAENVNDTYLGAWNAMPPHRPTVLQSFLGRIARNLALNKYKARQAEKRAGDEFALSLDELDVCTPAGVSVEDSATVSALAAQISAFLRGLPAEMRRAFVCRYFYAESVREIAARQGASESKIKSMLLRSRLRLKAQLEKEGYSL